MRPALSVHSAENTLCVGRRDDEIRAVGRLFVSRQSRATAGRERAPALSMAGSGGDDPHHAEPMTLRCLLITGPLIPPVRSGSIDRSTDRRGIFFRRADLPMDGSACDRLSVVERTNGRQAAGRQATPRPPPVLLRPPPSPPAAPHIPTYILTHPTDPHTMTYSGTMADKGPVTIRSRKFIRNALLARRQMVRGGIDRWRGICSVCASRPGLAAGGLWG